MDGKFCLIFALLVLEIVSGAVLNCQYEQDECILKSISLLGRSDGVEFKGSDIDKSNVKVINIVDSELEFLPKELETEFPNAYIFRLTNVQLNDVLDRNFMEHPHNKMESLTINGIKNEVKVLSAEFFSLVPHLKHLDISNSKFGILDSDLFKNSPEIKSIEIHDNAIQTIPSDVFNGIADLKSLHFQNNGLTFLDKTFFQDLETLVEVDLSKNKIDKIEPLTFEYLTNVRAVDLTGNVCVNQFFGLGSSPNPPLVHLVIKNSDEIKTCFKNWKE